jgi:hypothetical protein
MEDMSRPKRPPPMQANEPTTYYNMCWLSYMLDEVRAHTGLEAIAALYYIELNKSVFSGKEKEKEKPTPRPMVGC